VTKAVKNAEREHGIVSVPLKQEMVHHEVIRIREKDKEKITYSFVVKMTTRIADLDKPEDFIEVEDANGWYLYCARHGFMHEYTSLSPLCLSVSSLCFSV
jgi:hypothetical protein